MAYRNVSVWLEDILIAIERIEHHKRDTISAQEYRENTLVTDATERNLEVIAEALKNAVKLEPQLPISDVRKIINLRNKINHAYYEVNHDGIWLILKNQLPVLKTEVKKILEDYERRLELNEL